MSRTARFVHACRAYPTVTRALQARPLDSITILNALADSCTRAEDPQFWILTSAAAHLNGYNLDDGDGSTVAAWERYHRERAERAA